MSAPGDGGLAFPSVGEGFGNLRYSAPGMTLRDYFAGQAIIGILARDERGPITENAALAYKMADAMLKERSK